MRFSNVTWATLVLVAGATAADGEERPELLSLRVLSLAEIHHARDRCMAEAQDVPAREACSKRYEELQRERRDAVRQARKAGRRMMQGCREKPDAEREECRGAARAWWKERLAELAGKMSPAALERWFDRCNAAAGDDGARKRCAERKAFFLTVPAKAPPAAEPARPPAAPRDADALSLATRSQAELKDARKRCVAEAKDGDARRRCRRYYREGQMQLRQARSVVEETARARSSACDGKPGAEQDSCKAAVRSWRQERIAELVGNLSLPAIARWFARCRRAAAYAAFRRRCEDRRAFFQRANEERQRAAQEAYAEQIKECDQPPHEDHRDPPSAERCRADAKRTLEAELADLRGDTARASGD